MALWFRRTFSLAPNDPRFLGLTAEEMLTEYWAHHFDDLHRQGKLHQEAETDDWDAELAAFMEGAEAEADGADEEVAPPLDPSQWEEM